MLSPRRRALAVLTTLLATLVVIGSSTGPAGAVASDLLISEYVEGSSNNKALELENRTAVPVDLGAGGYVLDLYFNGAPNAGETIALTGTVAAGDVFVVVYALALPEVTRSADQLTDARPFNGNDAVVLRRAPDTVVDSIGQVGVDPGAEWGTGDISTQNNTLRRPASNDTADVDPSDAYDPAGTYLGFAEDSFLGLGFPGEIEGEPPPPELLAIGEVQGVVADGSDGRASRSRYAPGSGNDAGQTVVVRGVVTELSLAATSSGGSNRGFWLQEPAAVSDGDPLTSDGIFVFTGSSPEVDGHTPVVGDDLSVTAKVSEFFNATQLTSVAGVVVEAIGAAVPASVEADPPADVADAARYWERVEGMQVTIPAGASTTAGRSVFSGTADSEIWMIRGDDPLLSRADPYARRVFRDAHPLDGQPGLFDDGNGQRILVGPQGVKAAAEDPTLLLPPVRTFSTLDGDATGAVNYSFSKYRVELTAEPAFTEGVDPSLNGPPQPAVRATEYSVGDLNVENLYDRRDDPTDGCDFEGNAGCPGVSPPFDYVPADDSAYLNRLVGLAKQIAFDLHLPDVVTVQEAEDQDICGTTEPGSAVDCAAGDGKPDTLQDLAFLLNDEGGAVYEVASDRDGADDRGIHNGFLYRVDRVALADPQADDPILGADPGVTYRAAGLPANADVQNPKALNAELPADIDTSTGTDGSDVYTRAAQTGRFLVYPDQVGVGDPADLWLINNHFSSGPDRRIGQRREQAAYAAAIATAIEDAVPEARVMVAGDLNVHPRPDDPVAPADGGPSDQLGPLYDAGLTNLWDVLVAEAPAAAYSYAFEGQAQTLDQQLVGDALLGDLVEQRVAHVNADWPAEHQPVTGRGVSDHDPAAARFTFPVPPVVQLSDADFVRQQLEDFAGRPPTPAELDVFTEALGDGSRTRGRLVDDLRRVAYDPTRAPVIRLYSGAFARTADFPGTDYWAGRYEDGQSLRAMARFFVASPEFTQRYGELDDGGFIDQLYLNVLRRPSDPAGRDYWVGRLSAGTSRAEVLVLFTESGENQVRTRPLVDLTEIYHGLLERAPTASERSAGLARVTSVAGRVALVEEITASQEYADRVAA